MTITIMFLGVSTVVLSCLVAVRFFKFYRTMRANATRKLSLSIAFQLVGEAIIGLGTLVFACAAHFGWLDSWSVGIQSLIRFLMFFATATTTYHLFVTLKNMR